MWIIADGRQSTAYFLKPHSKSEALNLSTSLFIFYGMLITMKFYLENIFWNFDKYNRLHTFRKLYSNELLLYKAFCRSLYGFNPLTITPNRESVFKSRLLFLFKTHLKIVISIKSGLKKIWFLEKKCKNFWNRFFIFLKGKIRRLEFA